MNTKTFIMMFVSAVFGAVVSGVVVDKINKLERDNFALEVGNTLMERWIEYHKE